MQTAGLTAYCYTRLPSGYIRLSTILSAKDNLFVECLLVAQPADSRFPYYATSYARGTHADIKHILCNGGSLDVTPHLLAGVGPMYKLYGSSISIWLDAICIHQYKGEEKAAQVSDMDLVYQRAFALLIWLGAEVNGSDKAMAFIPTLHDRTAKSASGLIIPVHKAFSTLELPPRHDRIWTAPGSSMDSTLLSQAVNCTRGWIVKTKGCLCTLRAATTSVSIDHSWTQTTS